MSVPILYQGSRYTPGVTVPIPEPPTPPVVSYPNPNGLDYFSLGEPLLSLRGKVNSTGLDYFKLGDPFAGLSRTT